MLSLPAMPRLSLVLAVLGAGCAAPPVQGQVASSPQVEPLVLALATASPAAAPAPAQAPAEPAPDPELPACAWAHLLYMRGVVWPPKPLFEAAARAFDSATLAYERRRYLVAARGFMEAAASFLAAENLANRRWAYGNAASAWEMAGRVEYARDALQNAADRDPALGAELYRLAANLRAACTPGP